MKEVICEFKVDSILRILDKDNLSIVKLEDLQSGEWQARVETRDMGLSGIRTVLIEFIHTSIISRYSLHKSSFQDFTPLDTSSNSLKILTDHFTYSLDNLTFPTSPSIKIFKPNKTILGIQLVL